MQEEKIRNLCKIKKIFHKKFDEEVDFLKDSGWCVAHYLWQRDEKKRQNKTKYFF